MNLFGMGGVFVLQRAFGLVLDASRGTADVAAEGYPPSAYAVAFLLTAAGTAALLFHLPLAREAGLRKG